MSDIDTLAEQLWKARRDGGIVDPATVREPVSDAEAYAVQAAVMRLSGEPQRAFKVGSTSAEAQAILGTTEPGSCPVLAPYYYEAPAKIAIYPEHMPALEGEFALRLGTDLPPREADYAEAEVRDAVDAVAGAIEVVGSRLEGGLGGKGRFLTTADSGANIALVVGAWTTDWRGLDLKAHPVEMRVDGAVKGSGTGARALGDPINVVVWLANQQSRRGRGLKAGDVVSTGTCTGLDAVTPGNSVTADFGSLGQVDVEFQ